MTQIINPLLQVYNEPISRETLWTLERYSTLRPEFRTFIIQHKKNKTVHLGNHLNLLFEDTLTIRYQIQEMLRIEKTFEEIGIQAELSAYLPLIPDSNNLKATLMIEYPVVEERREALKRLKGIEKQIYIQINDNQKIQKIYAIADEDLERENDEKTSAVHFMRFNFDNITINKNNLNIIITIGVEHTHYTETTQLTHHQAYCLLNDLN